MIFSYAANVTASKILSGDASESLIAPSDVRSCSSMNCISVEGLQLGNVEMAE